MKEQFWLFISEFIILTIVFFALLNQLFTPHREESEGVKLKTKRKIYLFKKQIFDKFDKQMFTKTKKKETSYFSNANQKYKDTAYDFIQMNLEYLFGGISFFTFCLYSFFSGVILAVLTFLLSQVIYLTIFAFGSGLFIPLGVLYILNYRMTKKLNANIKEFVEQLKLNSIGTYSIPLIFENSFLDLVEPYRRIVKVIIKKSKDGQGDFASEFYRMTLHFNSQHLRVLGSNLLSYKENGGNYTECFSVTLEVIKMHNRLINSYSKKSRYGNLISTCLLIIFILTVYISNVFYPQIMHFVYSSAKPALIYKSAFGFVLLGILLFFYNLKG